MKQIKCLDCEKVFEGNSPEDVMKKMHPHYMSDHQDVMKDGDDEKQKEWYDKFNKNWEEAEEK